MNNSKWTSVNNIGLATITIRIELNSLLMPACLKICNKSLGFNIRYDEEGFIWTYANLIQEKSTKYRTG